MLPFGSLRFNAIPGDGHPPLAGVAALAVLAWWLAGRGGLAGGGRGRVALPMQDGRRANLGEG
jgi:hypothetical protein